MPKSETNELRRRATDLSGRGLRGILGWPQAAGAEQCGEPACENGGRLTGRERSAVVFARESDGPGQAVTAFRRRSATCAFAISLGMMSTGASAGPALCAATAHAALVRCWAGWVRVHASPWPAGRCD